MVSFIASPVGVGVESLANCQLFELKVREPVDGASRGVGRSRCNVEHIDEVGVGACVGIDQ